MFLGKDRIFVKVGISKFFHVWIGERAQRENIDDHAVFAGVSYEQFECRVAVMRGRPQGKTMACVIFKWDDNGCVHTATPVSEKSSRDFGKTRLVLVYVMS